jgi:tetratricopeptide (TPR) repeat protein
VANWREEPRTVLEHLVRQSSRTFEETSEEFTRVAVELGVDATLGPRHLRRLAAGERSGVRPQAHRVLQEMFGHSADVLFAPWTPEAAARITGEPEGAGHPTRKELTQEEILDMTIQRARQFTMIAGQYIADEAIDQFYGDVSYVAMAYPQQPLTSILGDLAAVQDNILTVLDERHRPETSKRLYLLGGVVGGILAKASHDMGDSHGALTHARAGFLCAEHAEHDGLRAWIKGLQSLIAFWAKRPHESLQYAQQGAPYAERSGNTTSVWLPVNEARAWAALGNAAKAQAAIERAEAAWEQAEPDEIDMLGGICTFGRSRQLYYAADALALLPGQADDAERYSQLALEAYADTTAPDWSFSDQAGSAADLAVARINKGEIEGAAEAIAPVLALPTEQRIHGIISSAQRVHNALRAVPEAQAVAELQMEIEAFTRAPLAGLPR